MVIADNARRTRMSLDPRWAVVQGAANCRALWDWRRAVAIAEDAASRRDRLGSRRIVAECAGMEARRHGRDHDAPRFSMMRTVADVMAGVFEGLTPEEMEEEFVRQFLEKQRRQSAELGEVIEMRSNAIDEELERRRAAGPDRDHPRQAPAAE
jgi:hypothetical protein